MSTTIRYYYDLEVYKDSFDLGVTIYKLSRAFPIEERYALTDQVRRSSRAVGAALAEAWGKRAYQAHFVMKLSDADAELQETEHWLRFAVEHGYLNLSDSNVLIDQIRSIGRRLGSMIFNPGPFLLTPPRPRLPVRNSVSP